MKKLFVFALALTMAAPAYAQPERGGPPDFVALGVGITTDYLGSDDFQPIPFGGAKISVPGADIYWRGLGLRADLLSPATGGKFVGGIDGRFQFGRDDVDSIAVNALPEIDQTFELGAFVGYRIFGLVNPRDSLTLGADTLFDIGGAYEGFTVTPNVAYSTALSRKLRTNVSLSAEYGSGNFMETYFGITPEGAVASGLDAFVADEGFYQLGTSVGFTYSLTRKWGVFGLVSYRRLIADAADSPIVVVEGSPNQFLGGLSLSYQF